MIFWWVTCENTVIYRGPLSLGLKVLTPQRYSKRGQWARMICQQDATREAVVTRLSELSLNCVWIPVLPNPSCITLAKSHSSLCLGFLIWKIAVKIEHIYKVVWRTGWVQCVESWEQRLPPSNHPICRCHRARMKLLLNDTRKKRIFDTVGPEEGGERASFQRIWKDRGKRLNSSWAHPMSLFVIPPEMSPKASHCSRDKSWISLWGWITEIAPGSSQPRWRLGLCFDGHQGETKGT